MTQEEKQELRRKEKLAFKIRNMPRVVVCRSCLTPATAHNGTFVKVMGGLACPKCAPTMPKMRKFTKQEKRRMKRARMINNGLLLA